MKTKINNNMNIEDIQATIVEQYNIDLLSALDAGLGERDIYIIGMMLAGTALALLDEDDAEQIANQLTADVMAFRTILRTTNPQLAKALEKLQKQYKMRVKDLDINSFSETPPKRGVTERGEKEKKTEKKQKNKE